MNIIKNHTRNQKRMYRIHKLEEKIKDQELLIGSLKQQLEANKKARKEAVEYIKTTSGYENPYNEAFLNSYAVDNLLEILEKENK